MRATPRGCQRFRAGPYNGWMARAALARPAAPGVPEVYRRLRRHADRRDGGRRKPRSRSASGRSSSRTPRAREKALCPCARRAAVLTKSWPAWEGGAGGAHPASGCYNVKAGGWARSWTSFGREYGACRGDWRPPPGPARTARAVPARTQTRTDRPMPRLRVRHRRYTRGFAGGVSRERVGAAGCSCPSPLERHSSTIHSQTRHHARAAARRTVLRCSLAYLAQGGAVSYVLRRIFMRFVLLLPLIVTRPFMARRGNGTAVRRSGPTFRSRAACTYRSCARSLPSLSPPGCRGQSRSTPTQEHVRWIRPTQRRQAKTSASTGTDRTVDPRSCHANKIQIDTSSTRSPAAAIAVAWRESYGSPSSGVYVSPGSSAAGRHPMFWPHWSDGKAEMNGYRLVQPRTAPERAGTAVLIYVTEDFSDSWGQGGPGETSRIGRLPGAELNEVRDFQTGSTTTTS